MKNAYPKNRQTHRGSMKKTYRTLPGGSFLPEVPFFLKLGFAKDEVPKLCTKLKVKTLVCDMSPLRVPMSWAKDVAAAVAKKKIAVHQVDAHNVVPVWTASDKLEYAARTIRPRITKQLPEFLTEFPQLQVHPYPGKVKAPKIDWPAAEKSLKVDRSVKPVPGFVAGAKAGHARAKAFCNAKRLQFFAKSRNEPNVDATSGLSPYIHFGQISAQRVALSAQVPLPSARTFCPTFQLSF